MIEPKTSQVELIMTNIKKRLTCCWYIDFAELRDMVEFELFVSSQLLLLVELVATILCSANSILRQKAMRQYLNSYNIPNTINTWLMLWQLQLIIDV